ncbi:hypothetical protein [Nonomuraea insulae]|uniref:Uncharacterized protein n=1 Tax=Nonomuraea insulae TaxID=1616787 RepID=A0ABW1CVB7_9ACTN
MANMPPRRPRTLIVAAVLALLAVTPPAYADTPAPAEQEQAPTTLTLITGDKVAVAPGRITVAGPGGDPIGARVITTGDGTYVYPDTATPYVTSGLLDDELFNVTQLIEDGYTGDLPVIVTYKDGLTARQALPFAGRALTSIGGTAVTREAGQEAQFWATLTGASPTARSASQAAEQLPLVQLDYEVETDGDGRAARRAPLTLVASHLPGGPRSDTIKQVTLDVSYDDGVTWREERLSRRGDGWRAELRAPSGARYVTLRAGAQDRKGNTIEQTIVRAYGLK